MEDNGTFVRLAAELPLEERNKLLSRLQSQSDFINEPLYEEKEKSSSLDVKVLYEKISPFKRILLFLLGLFKSKSPLKVYEDSLVAHLGKTIDAAAPGVFDCKRGALLPEFQKELRKLKDGSRFFYNALDVSVNRDKGAFFTFLASLEMQDVHRRLVRETNPEEIAKASPDASETELRQTAFTAMEEILMLITEDQRKIMYHNTRSLLCLKELSSFLFDRMLLAFKFDPSTGAQSCPVGLIKDLLINLNNILYSLQIPPSMTLLESLFVFILQDHSGDASFDAEAEMRTLLSQAELSISSIRQFNKHIPLTLIIRCGTRGLSYVPKTITGGEDWFVVYREYWKRHIEDQFIEYMRVRRQKDLLNSFRYFLKGTNLKMLDNVISDSNPDGIPVRGSFALSFLLTFYSAVFMTDINKILRPILIDGEFYKRDNRLEFTEAYNDLIKLEDEIKKIEAAISSEGEYGKRYDQARSEISSLPVKRRKIQIIIDEASEDAQKIIAQARAAVKTMINILNGIIKREAGDKYDTLSNLASLSGKGNAFAEGILESVQQFEKALKLLDDIEVMESGR
ncbi:DUF5312 domain-containing protein [Treponema sp. OttesenSCG-928-L16]|nr:DUF5312 domain-containing protein [Treponema sp. OttesenSCG-928-L16]